MKKRNRNSHRYREQADGCQLGAVLGGMRGRGAGDVKGLTSTNCQSQNSPGDVQDSIGNIVNNTVITTYGARWGSLHKLRKYLTTMLYT